MLTGTEVSIEQLVQLRPMARGFKLPEHLGALLTGNTRSAVRGRGVDYEESRKYTHGDDSRMIDWRVTARTGTTHTKIFREDRQRLVHLVVDMTSSMRFATRTAFKSVVAAEVASLIAWSALDQGNLVSITGVSDTELHTSRPVSVARGLARQLAMLSNLSRKSDTADNDDGLGDALSFVVRRVKPGDLVVVISDFSNLSISSVKSFEYFCARRALSMIRVLDRIEKKALPPGHYRITDGNSYSALRLSSKRRCDNMQQVLDERNEKIQMTADRLGISLINLFPGDDVSKVLHAAFQTKSRKTGGSQQVLA